MTTMATLTIPGSDVTCTLESVKLVRDADGCYCPACGMFEDDYTLCNVPWGWRNVRWMHERGTGHRVELVRRVWSH